MRSGVWGLVGAAVLLASCGGGGSGPITLNGVVATGAALAGATVTAFDVTGKQVGSSTSDAAGEYSITLTEAGQVPYLLRAVRDEISLTALQPSVTGSAATVNISPISDAVVALVSPTGQAATLLTALVDGSARTAVTATAVEEKRAVIEAAIEPVLKTVNVSMSDLLSKKFAVDGTGVDKVLDTLAVSPTVETDSSGLQKANLQITFKVAVDAVAASTSAPVVTLSSASSTTEVKAASAAVTITKESLPPDNMASLYSDFLQAMNACYALDIKARTDGGKIIASECKKIFFEENPDQYKHAGSTVGSKIGDAFRGIFNATAKVEFKSTIKQYLVHDLNGIKSKDGRGRAILSLSWLNTESGSRENISAYVTKYTDSTGRERLGLSGDKNDYGFFVNSHNQKFEFPLMTSSDLGYVLGSYLVAIQDYRSGTESLFNFVRVTSPNGKIMVFTPDQGGARKFMRFCTRSETKKNDAGEPAPKGNFCSGSYAITMSERFVKPAGNRVPSDIANVGIVRSLKENVDGSFEAYSPSDDEIRGWNSIGVWTADYFHKDGKKTTQRTWSVARPMTRGELIGPAGPEAVTPMLTADSIAALKKIKVDRFNVLRGCFADGQFNCIESQAPVPAPATGGFPFAWSGGTLPVTKVWISGRLNSSAKKHISSCLGDFINGICQGGSATSWDDEINFPSTTASITVPCSRMGESDKHCSDVDSNYSPQVWMSYSELWGKDDEQRTLMRSFNWFTPTKADGTPF